MPRRNRRDRPPPLDLTPERHHPETPPANPRPSPRLPRQPVQTHRGPTLTQSEGIKAERQREARMQGGIDWSVCLVPGCGRSTITFGTTPKRRRDPLVELPLCDTHAVVAWKTVQFHRPTFADSIAAVDELHEKRGIKAQRQMTVADQGSEECIYFLRHNGLIKVGWTKDFFKRLRSYGPATEVLCHYPGSRADETNLHRQLRPSLAKGREWYHDDERIALFVAEAIKRHGEPRITDGAWTVPKPDRAAKPRKWSA